MVQLSLEHQREIERWVSQSVDDLTEDVIDQARTQAQLANDDPRVVPRDTGRLAKSLSFRASKRNLELIWSAPYAAEVDARTNFKRKVLRRIRLAKLVQR